MMMMTMMTIFCLWLPYLNILGVSSFFVEGEKFLFGIDVDLSWLYYCPTVKVLSRKLRHICWRQWLVIGSDDSFDFSKCSLFWETFGDIIGGGGVLNWMCFGGPPNPTVLRNASWGEKERDLERSESGGARENSNDRRLRQQQFLLDNQLVFQDGREDKNLQKQSWSHTQMPQKHH